jgi:hypothetical protein
MKYLYYFLFDQRDFNYYSLKNKKTRGQKMKNFNPIRNLPTQSQWTSKDVMVVFGELFSRGYANGIVDEAQKKGMKIIYSTVGRRDENQEIRALTKEELIEKNVENIINIPLEAGFDLHKDSQGQTPVDQLKGIKMSEWDQVKLNWKSLEESQRSSIEDFRERVKKFLYQVESEIPDEANVFFVHTMAGGFPRAKVVMPVTNKVFKGYDDRYCSSKYFWESEIGKFCDKNFKEVTGETLFHLIDLTSNLRNKKNKLGKKVSYVAYGYHGTEVLLEGKYVWQSYSPYLQGWAKLHLENIAKDQFKDGVTCSVFNAPEILTNSSSIFLGVEVSLYPLLGALKKEGPQHPETKKILEQCQSLLDTKFHLEHILNYCENYLKSEIIKQWSDFENWPQHNGNDQMKLMRESSSKLIEMHKDEKQLITSVLSEVVFRSTGKIMFHAGWDPKSPVWWVGHDAIAKQTVS